jgi:hypothetical protein
MTPERIKEARGRLEFYRREMNAFLVDDVNDALDAIERARLECERALAYGSIVTSRDVAECVLAALEGKPE